MTAWIDANFDVGVCGLTTATNFCIPSTLLRIWWSRRAAGEPSTQLS